MKEDINLDKLVIEDKGNILTQVYERDGKTLSSLFWCRDLKEEYEKRKIFGYTSSNHEKKKLYFVELYKTARNPGEPKVQVLYLKEASKRDSSDKDKNNSNKILTSKQIDDWLRERYKRERIIKTNISGAPFWDKINGSGFPDYYITGLGFIEIKRGNEDISENQRWWLEQLTGLVFRFMKDRVYITEYDNTKPYPQVIDTIILEEKDV